MDTLMTDTELVNSILKVRDNLGFMTCYDRILERETYELLSHAINTLQNRIRSSED